LEKNCWENRYDFSLGLYTEATETTYLSKNFNVMEKYSAIVMKQAKTLSDKARVYEIKIWAHQANLESSKSVKIGLEVLKEAGVTFPKKPNSLNVFLAVIKTVALLRRRDVENLINLPEMKNKNKLVALRILTCISPITYLVDTKLFKLIIIKIASLSLRHGNSINSVQGYSAFGMIYCSVLADAEKGYKFGKLTLNLLHKFKADKIKPKILFIVNAFITPWKKHLKESLPSFTEGYQVAIDSGDHEYAAYNAHFFSLYSLLIGKELLEMEDELSFNMFFFKKIKHKIILNYNSMFRQIVHNLKEVTDTPWVLKGDAYDEEKVISKFLEANDPSSLFDLFLFKSMMANLFGSYEIAHELSLETEKYLASGFSAVFNPVHYFYDSLNRLALMNNDGEKNRRKFFNKVKKNQKKIKKWAKDAPMNYLHKWYLVEAEIARIHGKKLKAMSDYKQSIKLANENGYINEEALANELAAKFYFATNDNDSTEFHVKKAHNCYRKWGALGKVEHIEQNYPQFFKHKIEFEKKSELGKKLKSFDSKESQKILHSVLDFKTILKTSEILSNESTLSSLLQNLMKILIESAGAQRALLLLKRNREWVVEISGTADNQKIRNVESNDISIDRANITEPLPISIINYVSKTEKNVIFDNAQNNNMFVSDHYFSQRNPKSLLCFPLKNQGKLVCIVYMENSLVSGAFTKRRVEILKLLSSHAAIAIEKALLYNIVENQKRELSDLLAEKSIELSQVNDELKEKYQKVNENIDMKPLKRDLEMLQNYMTEEKPFKDDSLSLDQLAEKLYISPRYLSQVINTCLSQNFYTFINSYRVEEAKALLSNPLNRDESVLAIAYDSGFKSKTSFNTIFKKMTGMTPSQYKKA